MIPPVAFNPERMYTDPLDLIIFSLYLLLVVFVGYKVSSRQKMDSEDYFLAGRNLTWWIIGGSLIAANISTHHFIGMAGQGYTIGLAIASYEWLAAIMLIIYGKFFLPYYIRTGITTMPEFLERRFNPKVRLIFAIISLFGYVFIELAVVLFTGSLAMQSIFGLPLTTGLVILCVVAGGYTLYGGLRSVAYTDMIQVGVLIAGGITVTILGLIKVGTISPDHSGNIFGGFQALIDGAPDKFTMVQTWNHPELPWIGVFFGGLWLANLFYWGCNQFITQKTLAAKDIWHGQMGVVFAGYLKLLVPFMVVIPGIIAYKLYDPVSGLMAGQEAELGLTPDLSFPVLVKNLLPAGLSGLVMAGLMGAVMSTIASLLTSSSAIFTFDIYKRNFNPDADSQRLKMVGRLMVIGVLLTATAFGFMLREIDAIFTYIQRYWSIAWPAVSAVFLTGFFYKRATWKGALITMVVGPLWAMTFTFAENFELVPSLAFLNRATIDFVVCMFIIWVFRNKSDQIAPEAEIDNSLPDDIQAEVDQLPWYKKFSTWSLVLIAIIVIFYIRFF